MNVATYKLSFSSDNDIGTTTGIIAGLYNSFHNWNSSTSIGPFYIHYKTKARHISSKI